MNYGFIVLGAYITVAGTYVSLFSALFLDSSRFFLMIFLLLSFLPSFFISLSLCLLFFFLPSFYPSFYPSFFFVALGCCVRFALGETSVESIIQSYQAQEVGGVFTCASNAL